MLVRDTKHGISSVSTFWWCKPDPLLLIFSKIFWQHQVCLHLTCGIDSAGYVTSGKQSSWSLRPCGLERAWYQTPINQILLGLKLCGFDFQDGIKQPRSQILGLLDPEESGCTGYAEPRTHFTFLCANN
jgi:hypothetical protein